MSIEIFTNHFTDHGGKEESRPKKLVK